MPNVANPCPLVDSADNVAGTNVAPAGTQVPHQDDFIQGSDTVVVPIPVVTNDPAVSSRADSMHPGVGTNLEAATGFSGADIGPSVATHTEVDAGLPVDAHLEVDSLGLFAPNVVLSLTAPASLTDTASGSLRCPHMPIYAPSAGSSAASGFAAPTDSSLQASAARPRTRPHNDIHKPKLTGMARSVNMCLIATREPSSVIEALHHSQWKGAMDEEFRALVQNKMWHLVPWCEASNVIDCR
jgi:hypothetical protein